MLVVAVVLPGPLYGQGVLTDGDVQAPTLVILGSVTRNHSLEQLFNLVHVGRTA